MSPFLLLPNHVCLDVILHALELGVIVFPGSQLLFSSDLLPHPLGSIFVRTGHFRKLLMLAFPTMLREDDLVELLGVAEVADEALSLLSASSFFIKFPKNSTSFDSVVLSCLSLLCLLSS